MITHFQSRRRGIKSQFAAYKSRKKTAKVMVGKSMPAMLLQRPRAALPDHHLRGLLPARVRGELAADAALPALEVDDHRRQLRLLRLVGLALRPAARGGHVRQSGPGRADRARPQTPRRRARAICTPRA